MTHRALLFSRDVLTGPIRRFGRLRDVGTTVGTEFLVMAASFLALRLAAKHWGPNGFGEFVLFRRNIGLLQLPLSASLALGLGRFVAIARASNRSERAYGLAALIVSGAALSLAAAVALLFSEPLTTVLFGAPSFLPLMGGLLVAVTAAVLHGVAYGMFRGQQDMRRANLLQFTAVGVVPVAILLCRGLTVAESAYGIGSAWLVIAVVAVVVGLRRSAGGSSWGEVRHAVSELLRYGIPRVPGEFALSGVFAIPVLVLARRGGVEAAGHLGFGITLVSFASSGFAPLGLFVLPAIATRLRAGNASGVRRDVARLLGLCLFVAVTGVAVIQWVVPFLVTVGLGADFAAAVPVVRLALLAAIPYVCYVVLRAVLDAAAVWPYNAKNLLISLALFLVVVTIVPGTSIVVFAMLASIGLLGVLSIVDVWRVLHRDPRSFRD